MQKLVREVGGWANVEGLRLAVACTYQDDAGYQDWWEAQAGDLLAQLPHAPREVVLMHLSETNNAPHLARASAEAALGHRGTRLRLAEQRRPLELGQSRESQLQLGL